LINDQHYILQITIIQLNQIYFWFIRTIKLHVECIII